MTMTHSVGRLFVRSGGTALGEEGKTKLSFVHSRAFRGVEGGQFARAALSYLSSGVRDQVSSSSVVVVVIVVVIAR